MKSIETECVFVILDENCLHTCQL